MTLADLEAYQAGDPRADREAPTAATRIKSMAPPSSGALTVIQILKMLERFPLGDASQGLRLRRVEDAQRDGRCDAPAFADRADWMGDADFVPVPAKGLINTDYLGDAR